MFMMSKQAKPYVLSSEVESFLYSSLLHTTSCYPNQGTSPYNIQYLAEACSENKACFEEEDACQVLNKTMSQLLDSAFVIQEDARYKAYRFSISQYGEPLLELKKGNITANLQGAEVKFYTSSGNMNMTLRIYS
jgi:hypothetical protein